MNCRFKHVQTLLFLICFGNILSNCQAQGYLEVSQSIGIDHIHSAPMLMGGGVAFIDYNLDGYEDLYLTGGVVSDKLYRNNGDGTFTDVTGASGIVGTDTVNTLGVVVGDLDNDGDKEIFVTTWDGYHNLLFLNNGDGTFQDISLAAGIDDSVFSISATMGDVNGDGLLDIYVGNYVDLSRAPSSEFYYTCFANYLYINTGNNLFIDSGLAYGVADTGCALAVAFTDYDMEQDVDLYIANDFGKWVRPNALYNNSFPTPTYADSTLVAGINDSIFGMGIAIGDYDEDGDFDYYVTNLGRNVLRQNQGSGTFLDYTDTAGVTNTFTDSTFFAVGWGTAFYDYDNDTYLDLIVSNGYIPADSFIYNSPNNPNVLFRNTGNGIFQDVSDAVGFNDSTIGRGLAIGDFNYDGAVDVVVGVADGDTSGTAHTLVLVNNEQGNNWLKISLQGVYTNRDAYGSQLAVFAGGRKFIREIDGGSSHVSHNSSIAHFGLGNFAVVDSITVNWLNGALETFSNVAVNQQIHIIEDSLFYSIHYQTHQICPGDSISLAGSYQFLPGIYSDTLLSISGSDSIVHSSLTIITYATNTVLASLCTGDSIYAGGAYQSTSGIYVDTLTGSLCDSIVTTDVSAYSDIFTVISDTICNGDLYNGVMYTNDTILIGNYFAASSCDSTVTTNLTVHQISSGILDTSICKGDLYLGDPYYQNTVLVDTFANSFGCDSIFTTSISILSGDTTTFPLSLCEGDSVNGLPIFVSAVLIDTNLNIYGCDSISILDVSVWPVLFTNTNVSAAWGDTLNGIIVYSDTTIIETNLSLNGCDSIEQFMVTVANPVSITQYHPEIDQKMSCYPNPFSASLSIEFSLSSSDVGRLIIYDMLGRELAVIFDGAFEAGKHKFTWNGTTISGSPAHAGMYLCSMIASKTKYSVPIMLLE